MRGGGVRVCVCVRRGTGHSMGRGDGRARVIEGTLMRGRRLLTPCARDFRAPSAATGAAREQKLSA